MDERAQIPRPLMLATIVVFVTMVVAACLLVVFLYNLPVIFPPPGGQTQAQRPPSPTPTAAGITLTPALQPTLNPTNVPPLNPTAALTPAPTAVPTFAATNIPPAAPPVLPTLVPSISPTPPPPPATSVRGQIVFVSERLGFTSIHVMDANGTNQRLLVQHQGSFYDYAPAVSPDRRHLAFSSNREGPGTDNIYLMHMDGSNLQRITSSRNAKNASASWFPDGRRLAFSSNRSGRWQAYTMEADGDRVRQIIKSDQDIINVAVAPNGRVLAYTCGNELCLANPDGSDQRVLLRNGQRKDLLAWSPDSTLLAYSQVSSGQTSLHVVDLRGTSRQIVAHGAWPTWSPEGTRLVFASDMYGAMNLFLYDFTNGEIRRLTDTRAADYTPIWIRN